ncbi:hypothetical protein [Actinokineospora spheciospongiae]|uniref:hypothetical protein n=1 Tax=Actinokineospora spheciospongiae TaxID=909613 RepID=UPI000D86BA88|nr:hypothetical protein [Actinokineospora spheciospongiae]PWW50248.1 hypothetical protein DFQ13_12310 [Actinokineospora spheciospongiae]
MTGIDTARRRAILCACGCGRTGPHRGHGYITACYSRWIAHGRPETGPPAPGASARKPSSLKGTKRTATCVRGHDRSCLAPGAVCPDCQREHAAVHQARRTADARAAFAAEHAGHDTDRTRDGRNYCRTCRRGDDYIDEIAVERAVAGSPPARLTVAEREAAVVELRGFGYPFWLIAHRVGISLRTAWRLWWAAQERDN